MTDLFKRYSEENLEEQCGLILAGGEIIDCHNIHPEPTKGFEIDAEVILRYLSDIEATWHTHPNASSVLSGDDHLCFANWPKLDHYVIGNDGIRVYKVIDGAVQDANYLPR